MNTKLIAAALAGLCFTGGAAIAGPENAQAPQPQIAAPAQVPEAVGATNDVVILEIGPALGGSSAEETAAMQMLLLQLLLMQSEGAALEMAPPPSTSQGVGI